jgi:hypothetical protein
MSNGMAANLSQPLLDRPHLSGSDRPQDKCGPRGQGERGGKDEQKPSASLRPERSKDDALCAMFVTR